MVLKRRFELVLVLIFFIFSLWLMGKSFGYVPSESKFRIARNQIGDFGLHLSLIRSFSWGNNFPPESPFFPGKQLPYHYYFDLLVGLLNKIGFRLDIAFNGLSAIFFTALLFLIYKLPQMIFKKSKLLGLISVILFVFHSSLSFLDFFKNRPFSASLIKDIWLLPDYINKGPFDNSQISIFFTFDVFLNQRHLIAALSLSLFVIYFFIKNISNKNYNLLIILFLGLLLGLISRFHSLIFVCTSIFLFFLLILFKRFRLILLLFTPALFVFYFHARDIMGQNLNHTLFNPGFLSAKPLTIISFSRFWFLNLGLAIIYLLIGFVLSNTKQRKIFFCFLPLFIIGNIFQFSFRIDHNHSLFNFFIIFANFYVAFTLIKLLKYKKVGILLFIVSFFFLTFSGFLDLMAVKNDFQYPFYDAPRNIFMQWVKENTQKNDIFLSKEEILDPITLSGRKNYFGHRYYSEVMGYDFSNRKLMAKRFFEASSLQDISLARKEKIKYIVVPLKKIVDFNYNVNILFLKNNLKQVYADENVLVFGL